MMRSPLRTRHWDRAPSAADPLWKPVALANMLTRLPTLEDLCYEPWREWTRIKIQPDRRKCLLDPWQFI